MGDRIYEAFDSIKADEKTKALTKQAIAKEREKRKNTFARSGKLLAAGIALFLILGAGGYYGMSAHPTSYLSIDINPSIELSLNCWNRVIRATPYNDDGKRVLEELSLKGMKLEDALDTLMKSEAMAPYLEKAEGIDFTVAADSKGTQKTITDAINDCGSSCGRSVTSYYASEDSVEEAHDHGMSFGKYNAYRELSDYDDSITPDDCDHMSVSEMHSMAHRHGSSGHHGGGSQDGADDYQDSGHHGSGSQDGADDYQNSGHNGSGHHGE